MTQEATTTRAVIPARSGSRRVPGKNLSVIGGKPMISWTIEASLEATSIDDTVVTTDDPEVGRLAEDYGVTVIHRSQRLARDDSPMAEVVAHTLECLPSTQTLVLLQPTSPFRNASHIDTALRRFRQLGDPSGKVLASACAFHRAPNHLRIHSAGTLTPLTGDKEELVRSLFVLNGAIYVADQESLLRVEGEFSALTQVLFEMSPEDGLDIDYPIDLEFAHFLMSRRLMQDLSESR